MATYTVKVSQNIFDIALLLYGSVEGIYDLLISNPSLSMDTELVPGMELEYHDYFVINEGIVSEINARDLKPANGQRKVYFKDAKSKQVFQFNVPSDDEAVSFRISGSGNMIVDWGDNSALESILLRNTLTTIYHNFDNNVDERVVKIFGDFTVLCLDATNIPSQLYSLRPIVVDEFICGGNNYPLDGLFLFDGTYKVDLRGMQVTDLSPINDMSLQELDLRDVYFERPAALDEYLVQLVSNHGTRRDCKVLLTTTPGESGMAAIQTIINEPEWNASGAWVFDINGTIYTAS